VLAAYTVVGVTGSTVNVQTLPRKLLDVIAVHVAPPSVLLNAP
jgi:hypothetical protein